MQKDDHSLFACANPDRLGASPLHVRQQTVYVVATTSSYFFDVLAIPPGQADEAAVRGGGGERPKHGSSNCNNSGNSNSSRVTVRTDEQTVIVTGNDGKGARLRYVLH